MPKLDIRQAPPSVKTKWKQVINFTEQTIYHQYTLGYSAVESRPPSEVDRKFPDRVDVNCDTPESKDCPFSIAVIKYSHVEGNQEMSAYKVDETTFHPLHDHEPFYLPLNIEMENARRTTLQKSNPSLTKESPECKPTLIPIPRAIQDDRPPTPPPASEDTTTPISFTSILLSINPKFKKFLSDYDEIGLTDFGIESILKFSKQNLWELIAGVEAGRMTVFEKVEVYDGVMRVLEERRKHAGSLGTGGRTSGKLEIPGEFERKYGEWFSELKVITPV